VAPNRNRDLLVVGAALAALSFMVAGCGGDGDGGAAEPAPSPTVVGNFVGEAPSVEGLIAIRAEAPDLAGKRTVTIFACNAEKAPDALGAWFVGTTSSDSFKLTSSSPTLEGQQAEVSGTLSQEEASGTITFSAGFSKQRLDFAVPLARFPASVYEATLKPSGAFAGKDTFGSAARIEGEYSGFAAGDEVVKRFVLSEGDVGERYVRKSTVPVSPGLFRAIETGSGSIGRMISPKTSMFTDPYRDL
jgi:hypothetical protein